MATKNIRIDFSGLSYTDSSTFTVSDNTGVSFTGITKAQLTAGYPFEASNTATEVVVRCTGGTVCLNTEASGAITPEATVTPTPTVTTAPPTDTPTPTVTTAPPADTPTPTPTDTQIPFTDTPTPTPEPVVCYEYDLYADGGDTVTFVYTDCTDGTLRDLDVPNGDGTGVCARETNANDITMSPNTGTVIQGVTCSGGGKGALTATPTPVPNTSTPTPTPQTTYYIFDACDGGETILATLGTAPLTDRLRYVDYSQTPNKYFVYTGNTTTSTTGYTVNSNLESTGFDQYECLSPTTTPTPPIATYTTSPGSSTSVSGTGSNSLTFTIEIGSSPYTFAAKMTANTGSGTANVTLAVNGQTISTGPRSLSAAETSSVTTAGTITLAANSTYTAVITLDATSDGGFYSTIGQLVEV